VFVRLFGIFGTPEMTLFLTNKKILILQVIPMAPTRGAAGGNGFRVQPFGDGCSGLFSRCGWRLHNFFLLMYQHTCIISRWPIQVATLCDP
jgi:hypothetical protein